jgi:hypothetical protein
MTARRSTSALPRSMTTALGALALSSFLSLTCTSACSHRERGAEADASVEARADAGVAADAGIAADPGVGAAARGVPAEVPVAPERAAPIAEKDFVWKAFRGDHFAASFPGEPKVTVLPEEDDKVGYTEARVEVPGGQVSFAAGFSDYPAPEVAKPDAFLDDHANQPRRGFTEVLHKRTVTLAGGHPGRVLILRRNISGTPLRVYSRLYLVGRRLYSLIVSTLDVGGVSEDVVKRFMDSFKLR